MIAFQTAFCDPTGTRRRMLVYAADASEARAQVVRKGGIPMSVVRERRPERVSPRATLKSETAISMVNQLAMLLEAGVPLDRALQEVIHESPNDKAKAMLAQIHRRLCSNGFVAEAFAEFPRQFPAHLQQLLKVGQQSGRLSHAFRELSNHWNEAAEIHSTIRRAATYPAIAMTVVGAVICFLLGYVLPLFDRVFKDLGVTLPGLTHVLIQISRAFSSHWPVGFGALGVFVLCVFVASRCEQALLTRDRLVAKAPGFKGVIQALAISRMAGLLGAMQRAGLPIQDAMQLCLKGTGNRWYDGALNRVLVALRSGKSLSDALERACVFPPTAIATIRIGEQSGGLEQALAHVRAQFTRVAAERVQRLLQWLEPVLTIGLGLGVGTVAVSLFHPLVMLAINIKR